MLQLDITTLFIKTKNNNTRDVTLIKMKLNISDEQMNIYRNIAAAPKMLQNSQNHGNKAITIKKCQDTFKQG